MKELEIIRQALTVAAIIAQGRTYAGITPASKRIQEAQDALNRLEEKLTTHQTEFHFPTTTGMD